MLALVLASLVKTKLQGKSAEKKKRDGISQRMRELLKEKQRSSFKN